MKSSQFFEEKTVKGLPRKPQSTEEKPKNLLSLNYVTFHLILMSIFLQKKHNSHMKIKQLLLTTFALVPFAQAQVYSDVVGYVKLGSDTGDSVPANTEVTVSIPFVNEKKGVYTVDSWTFDTSVANTGGTIVVNETLTAGAFDIPTTGAPYMVEVSSGTDEGIFLEISSNDTTTINLSGYGTEFLASLAAGDTITIRKAWTLQTAFGSDLPDNTFISTFDNTGVDASAEVKYITYGGDWYHSTSGDLSNDLVVYPGEGFIYRNNTANAISDWTISGNVTTTNSRVRLMKDSSDAQETTFSYFNPVDETLGDSGLSAIASNTDYILFFDNSATGVDKSATKQYIFYNGDWYDSTTGSLANSVEMKGGQSYVYRRVDTGTSDTFVVDEQDYQPNL